MHWVKLYVILVNWWVEWVFIRYELKVPVKTRIKLLPMQVMINYEPLTTRVAII